MKDIARTRELAHAALASLERSRRRIDDLNVYPVPDGDTGTNMTMTARAVVEELDQTQTEERLALIKEVTRAALMGARGNSGVILSQIIRGAAETLGTINGAVDTQTVAGSFRSASDAAYRAVRQPVEGTMLSVIRELAEEGELRAGEDLTKAELFAALVRRGEEAVARTPEQLDVLREAGVVDAGGAGLLEIVRGLAAAVTGEPLPETPAEREEMLQRYNHYVDVMTHKHHGRPEMVSNNYNWGSFRNEVNWAVATYYESPAARDFLQFALGRRWQENFVPYAAASGKGGVAPEGSQYGRYMLQYVVVPALTLKSFGRDLFRETDFHKEAVYSLIYWTTPGPTLGAEVRPQPDA